MSTNSSLQTGQQTRPACLGENGYTLVELLSVAAVIMFAGIFLLRLSHSITGRDQFTTTDNHIAVIEAKIRQYYLAHQQLPGNAANEIPVDIAALDLEQKYRLDGWGHYFRYTTENIISLTDVDGRAASIVSGGPDQNITAEDDNITVYIDLSTEAEEITRKKIRLLMEKVSTYDSLFAGIDNDGVNTDNPGSPESAPQIDEDPLDPVNTEDENCPPVSGFMNDPASGLPTLDSIEAAMDGAGGNRYACATGSSLATHLVIYYHLRTGFTDDGIDPGGYDVDPWQNSLQWGYIGKTLDDGSIISDSMNPRYHTFFSSGPDSTTIEDDIIVYQE